MVVSSSPDLDRLAQRIEQPEPFTADMAGVDAGTAPQRLADVHQLVRGRVRAGG